MHILHVRLKITPERIPDFISATIENAKSSLREPGCVRFEIIQDASDASHFELLEVYRDDASHAAHRDTPHYKAWIDRATGMMAEPRTRTIYRNVYPDDSAF
jgi:(4S)-4-hydroxy-5-phosphonooxypentane-2,3-dione isomerase